MDRMSKLDVLKGLAPDRPVIKDSPTTFMVGDEFNPQPIEEVVSEMQSAMVDMTASMKMLVEESKK